MLLLLVFATSISLASFVNGQNFGSFPPLPNTGVRLFLGEKNVVIPDFSVIRANLFHDHDHQGPNGVADYINDGIWCQSSLNQTMIGSWYLPNGSPVPTVDFDNFYLQSINTDITGQVGLLRDGGLSGNEGLYKCVIPNENGINQTLYVAAYGGKTYDRKVGPVVNGVPEFKLLSINPPVFSLSFTVTDRPPTTVTCSVNGNDFTISDNDLIRVAEKTTDPINVTVTVIVRMRVAGLYMCTISNQRTDMRIHKEPDIDSTTTPGKSITVTGTPSGLTYTRTSVSSVVVSWSGPVDSIQSRYKVFITNFNNNGTSQNNITTNETQLSLSSLQPDVNYLVSVVAIGEEDLPSESIEIVIPNIISLSIKGPPAGTAFMYNSNFTLTCIVNLNITFGKLTRLYWMNSKSQVVKHYVDLIKDNAVQRLTNDNIAYSFDLTFNELQASQVGRYYCNAVYNNIRYISNFTVSVQVPNFDIVIMILNNRMLNDTRIFESSEVQLVCYIDVPLLTNVTPNVTIKWWGPNGIIHKNRYNITIGTFFNKTIAASRLKISSVSLSDNGSEYYCTSTVGADDSFEQSSLIIPTMETSANVSLIVEAIPLPQAEFKTIGVPIINETFGIECIPIIPAELLGIADNVMITAKWLYVSFSKEIIIYNQDDASWLIFSQVNRSQKGVYTCEITLEIHGTPLHTKKQITYPFNIIDNPVVVVNPSGRNIAGETYSLNCSVSSNSGASLRFSWLYGNGTQIKNGSKNVISENKMTFKPLDYSHVGVYVCVVRLFLAIDGDVFTGQGNYSSIVRVKIPPPTISITTNGSLVRGTVRELTCTVNLISPLPPSFKASTVIMRDGGPVNDPRIQSTQLDTTKMFIFIPVDTTDGGKYNCTGSVISTHDQSLIISASNSTTLNGVIEGIPTPIITVTTTGSGILGEKLLSVCSVDILDDLYDITVNISINRVNEGILNNSIGSGDVSISLLTESLMTSDAGQYQCIVDISQSSINYQFTNVTSFELTTTIPTPDVTISTVNVNPTILVEGQSIDIVCNVTISEGVDTGIDLSVIWRKDGGSPLTTNTDYTIRPLTNIYNMYTSTLRINSLHFRRDNGAVYSCSITVEPSPSNQYISVNGSNSDSITLTVANFHRTHIKVNIVVPNIPTAGDDLSLTCEITVPKNLVHVPSSVIWSYTQDGQRRINILNKNAVISSTTRNGNVFYSKLRLYSLTTADAIARNTRRMYCITHFQSLDAASFTYWELLVKIPPPTVTITGSPSTGPIYESTNYNLTCTATVPSVVDTPVSGSVVWTDPKGLTIPVNDSRRIITNVTSSGTNEFTNTLVFLPIDNGDNNLKFNDAGTYTCQMTISSIDTYILNGVNEANNTITNIQTLPDLQVDVSTSGSTEVGQSFNITFTLKFVERFVTSPTITVMRIGDSNDESHDDITLMDYVTSTDNTGSITNVTLMFDPLRFENRGMYIYSVEYNVTGVNNTNDPTTATYDASEAMNNYTLTVDFPTINVSLVEDCTDVGTGVSLSFRCEIKLSDFVTMPVTVTNQWKKNDVILTGDNSTTTVDFIKASNLYYQAKLNFFPFNSITYAGIYSCNVRATSTLGYIHDGIASNRATINKQVQKPPNLLTNIKVNVGSNSATIIIVPEIAYNIETYIVQYSGIQFQSTLTSSPPLTTTSSPQESYEIKLKHLEEANTYKYNITSTNCIGSITTDIMEFTTLPALPASSPTICTNTTFLSRSISLRWSPPLRINQNGEIIGYNLTCFTSSGRKMVYRENSTRHSPATTYTINDVVPFTRYTCRLSSINEVGEGPSTVCSFETAQDRPDDAPRNFESSADRTSVTFKWNIPAAPNGIIIGYNLTVVNIDTSITTSYMINNTNTEMTIGGFKPYQSYRSTVSGSTIAGYGPEAVTSGRTDPDVSSSPQVALVPVVVQSVVIATSIPVINDTAVNITWKTPKTPNGGIFEYILRISNGFLDSIIAKPDKTSYTVIINGLKPGIYYDASVKAINEAGEGNLSIVYFFTNSETPTIYPDIVKVNRSIDGMSMLISWSPVHLDKSGGYFLYRVTANQSDDWIGKKSTLIEDVRFNTDKTSVNMTGLDSLSVYIVTLSLITVKRNGKILEGPHSSPMRVQTPVLDYRFIPVAGGMIAGGALLTLVIVTIAIFVMYLGIKHKDKITTQMISRLT